MSLYCVFSIMSSFFSSFCRNLSVPCHSENRKTSSQLVAKFFSLPFKLTLLLQLSHQLIIKKMFELTLCSNWYPKTERRKMFLCVSEVRVMGKFTSDRAVGKGSWLSVLHVKGRQCLSSPHQVSILPGDYLWGQSFSTCPLCRISWGLLHITDAWLLPPDVLT